MVHLDNEHRLMLAVVFEVVHPPLQEVFGVPFCLLLAHKSCQRVLIVDSCLEEHGSVDVIADLSFIHFFKEQLAEKLANSASHASKFKQFLKLSCAEFFCIKFLNSLERHDICTHPLVFMEKELVPAGQQFKPHNFL